MARILLLSRQRRNRELFVELLGTRHQVSENAAGEDFQAAGDYDLLVADGAVLQKLEPRVRELKQQLAPEFLPVLLLTSRRDVRLARRLLWQVADDLIFTPVEKTELQARVEILLKARELSRLAVENYFNLSEASPLAALIVRSGRVLYASSRAQELGLGADAGPEATVLQKVFPGPELERLEPALEQAQAGAGAKSQFLELGGGPADNPRLLEAYLGPCFHAGQQCAFVLLNDVTERKRLLEQLAQSSKLESIGRLAGGVAHDFNNLLTVINGYAEEMLADLPKSDPLRQGAEQVLQAGQRAAQLTAQLLAFSRKQMLQPRVVDVAEHLRGLERLLGRLLGEDIELTLRPTEKLHLVKVDPTQLTQVLMNLAANARDAMPDGGRLIIEAYNAELDEQYVRQHQECRPGPHLVLAVTDSGRGMDKQTLSRVFEPFFTTKGVGQGTGLGLAQVHGIVRQSGGHVWLYSEPGQGTTVKIYLPAVAEKQADAGQPVTPDQESLRGRGTVLVVEDEQSLLRLTRKALERQGYQVLTARSAERALDLVAAGGPVPDLLVTDVVLPGMNGRELAERLRENRPGLRVLFTSGYSDDAVLRRGVREGRDFFLPKPFTLNDLARAVKKAMGSDPDT